MMKVWLLFPAISAPMPFQLALDEILFRRIEAHRTDPVLRFYFSSEPWISMGYSSRLPHLNPLPLKGGEGRVRGLSVTRRITGGGRVEHGRDVMFSLVARKADDASFSSVRMSYLKIHEAVKSALEGLGAPARFFRCDEKLPKGDDCFLYPIATDLGVGNRKVAGGGQRRSGQALLHQESILPIKGTEESALILAIRAGFEKIFMVKLNAANFDPRIFKKAGELAQEKYAMEPCLSS